MNQNQRDTHFSQLAEEEIAERAAASIARKNIEFALAHQNDSLEQLKSYLQDCTKALGRTPTRTEIVSGEFIDYRFGSWKSAVEGVGEWKSSMEYFPKPLENTKLYQAELRVQREKRKAEHKARRKAERQQRKAEQAAAESESAEACVQEDPTT